MGRNENRRTHFYGGHCFDAIVKFLVKNEHKRSKILGRGDGPGPEISRPQVLVPSNLIYCEKAAIGPSEARSTRGRAEDS
jgi:hypothetical protein